MVGRGETTATTPRQQPYRVIAANSDNTSPQRSFPPTAFYPRPTPVYLHQYQTSDSSADSIPVSAESARARVVGYQIPQLQISESPVEGGAPLSPESGARVVSYRIHPVSSDTDVDTRSRVVYSSECRAPVGQYQLGSAGSSLQAQGTGGWTVGSNDDQYNARSHFAFLLPVFDFYQFNFYYVYLTFIMQPFSLSICSSDRLFVLSV